MQCLVYLSPNVQEIEIKVVEAHLEWQCFLMNKHLDTCPASVGTALTVTAGEAPETDNLRSIIQIQ